MSMIGHVPSMLSVCGGLSLMDSVLEIETLSYVMGTKVKQIVSSVGFLKCTRHEKLSF